MKIRELMTTPIISVPPEMTVAALDRMLSAKSISGVPVLSEDAELLGMVSKTDVVRALADEPDLLARGCQVWEIMTPDVLWVDIHAPIAEVARKMLDLGIHRVLVYEGESMVGMISTFDFLKVVAAPADAD